ncbi:MAG: protein kinase [Clostridia bacterium]|nr:protein kinase [Clostridia bacterium]
MTHYEHYLGQCFKDRYTLVSIIGIGECSAVFGAYDGQTGQTVALKMLAPDRLSDTEAVKRFLAEIEVLSLFDHPNIVKILDTSLDDENKFFVMEYIEGITLKKHILSKGALSEEEILFLSRPILSALEEVHTKGIVHCDIKPQNVVLIGSGEIKLMDFGISKIIANQSDEVSEVTVGTVQYVSPEQAEGKRLSPTSDLYSFGVMLYEMATGVLPFVDDDQSRVAAMQVSSSPIPPCMVSDAVSPELDALILRCMEKSPEARPLSTLTLLAELEDLHTPKPKEPKEQKAVTVKDIFNRLDKRSSFAGVLCALFLCVIVSLSILFSSLANERESTAHVRIPDLLGEAYISDSAFGLDGELYSVRVEYVPTLKKSGTVISQEPAPNKIVKRGDTPIEIKLTVARSALPKTMPNVTYMKESDALAYLERYGVTPHVVYEAHDYLPSGYVTRTDPMPNEKSSKKITLYVSK